MSITEDLDTLGETIGAEVHAEHPAFDALTRIRDHIQHLERGADLLRAREAWEELAKLRQLVSALEWLPAMIIAFTDVDGFLEEVREMGWRPDPEPYVTNAAPSVGEWIPVAEQTPKGVPLIGLDRFYGRVGECFWDGKRRCDDGTPFAVFVDSDDCSITHYQLMPAAPPLPATGER